MNVYCIFDWTYYITSNLIVVYEQPNLCSKNNLISSKMHYFVFNWIFLLIPEIKVRIKFMVGF